MIDELKKTLQESWVRVEFTKVDGTHRSMLCTKNFVDIPDEHKPAGAGKKPNESVISVFDLEKQAWRSIRIDNIIKWAPEKVIE